MRRTLVFLMLAGRLSAELANVPGGLFLPKYDAFATSGSSFPNISTTWGPMAANGHKLAFILRAPKTGTLGKVRVLFSAVTKGGSTDLKVSFQDVDAATGFPDGGIDQYRVIPNADIVVNTMPLSGLLTSDGTDGGTKRSVVVGEPFAVVTEFNTFTAGDSISLGTIGATANRSPHYYAYCRTDTTGSWSGETGRAVLLSLEYDDGTSVYMPNVFPWGAVGSVAYNSGSATNVYALQFQLPLKAVVSGAWVAADLDGDTDVVLYTSSGSTILASLDKDIRQATTPFTSSVMFTGQTIEANTTYVLALRPTTTTSTTLAYVDYPSTAAMNQFSSSLFIMASAKDPTTTASFASTALRQPYMGLIITQVDDGTGAGPGVSAAMPTVISH